MFDWILSNKADIWMIFTSVIAVASMIVKLTPSKKDDKWVNKILAVIALNKK